MSDHRFVTKLAWEVLSPTDRGIWGEHAAPLASDYCTWPDQYFGEQRYPQIAPYQLVIDGLPFHYPPLSEVRYHWGMTQTQAGPQMRLAPEVENLNWRFMREGFTYYLTKVSEELKQGRPDEAAKFMGILLHVLQDTHNLHALEGPWGAHLFILDHIMPWPEGDRYITPTSLLAYVHVGGSIQGYRPQLLGTSVDEAVFRLYARYVEAALKNRRVHVPMVQARMRGDHDEANGYFEQINETVARLSADALHTVVALATGTFDEREVEALRTYRLEPMAAVQRPWNAPGAYRFAVFVPGGCLDKEFHVHPLRTRDAQGRSHAFEHGWGSGVHLDMALAYELPAGVYDRLRGHIGLHDTLGMAGRVDFTVLHRGEPVVRQRLDAESPTLDLDVPIGAGGEIRFRVQKDKTTAAHDNHLVWGDVRVVKGEGGAG